MHELGLGRKVSTDERDRLHLARPVVEEFIEPQRPYKYHWNLGARLHQLKTGTCVGHGWVHFLENGPLTRLGTLNPFDFYRALILRDEWSDNDHEAQLPDDQLQFGSSVRAGAKEAQARGFITEYLWAWDLDTAVRWLWTKAPLVLGVNWYTGMFYPDQRTGLIEPTGKIEGGHCVILDGVSMTNRLVRGLNSWGRDWGLEGTFWMSFDTLAKLIDEDGEACMAREIAA